MRTRQLAINRRIGKLRANRPSLTRVVAMRQAKQEWEDGLLTENGDIAEPPSTSEQSLPDDHTRDPVASETQGETALEEDDPVKVVDGTTEVTVDPGDDGKLGTEDDETSIVKRTSYTKDELDAKTHTELKKIARDIGAQPSRTKDVTISRILDKLSED